MLRDESLGAGIPTRWERGRRREGGMRGRLRETVSAHLLLLLLRRLLFFSWWDSQSLQGQCRAVCAVAAAESSMPCLCPCREPLGRTDVCGKRRRRGGRHPGVRRWVSLQEEDACLYERRPNLFFVRLITFTPRKLTKGQNFFPSAVPQAATGKSLHAAILPVEYPGFDVGCGSVTDSGLLGSTTSRFLIQGHIHLHSFSINSLTSCDTETTGASHQFFLMMIILHLKMINLARWPFHIDCSSQTLFINHQQRRQPPSARRKISLRSFQEPKATCAPN